MGLNMILTLAGGLAVLLVLAAFVLVKKRTAYLGPVKEELQKEKMWLRRGEYNAAMVKGRQNLELLLKLVAEKNGIQLDNTAQAVANAREEEERQSQSGQKKQKGRKKEKKVMTHHQFNRWLAENGYLDRVAKWEMNQVRLIGNKAVHENYADKDDAWNQYNYLEDILKTVTEKSQNPKKHHERHGDAEKKAEDKKRQKRQGGQKDGSAQNNQNGKKDGNVQKGQKGKKNERAQNSQVERTGKTEKVNQSESQVQKKQKTKQTLVPVETPDKNAAVPAPEIQEQRKKRRRRKKTKKPAESTLQVMQAQETAAPAETEEAVTKSKRRRRRKKKPQAAQSEQLATVQAAEPAPQNVEKAKPEQQPGKIIQAAESTSQPTEEQNPGKKKRRRRRRKPQSAANGRSAANTVVPEDKNETI